MKTKILKPKAITPKPYTLEIDPRIMKRVDRAAKTAGFSRQKFVSAILDLKTPKAGRPSVD